VRLNLPRFTLIGATTRSGLLTAPLLTRFPMRERLDYYVAGIWRPSSSARRVVEGGDRTRRRARNRPAQPRHAAHREQPASGVCALRTGPHDGRITADVATRRWPCWKLTRTA